MSYMDNFAKGYRDHLFEEYGDRFEDVGKAMGKEMTDDAKVRLGILLENVTAAFDKRFTGMLNEDTTMSAPHVIEGIKTQYLDIITAVFPNLIAEEIFSVQPIQQKMGEIFYLKYVYGTAKGNIQKGDTIFSHTEIAGYENRNYTAEHQDAAVVHTTNTDGAQEFTLDVYPVVQGSLVITIDSDILQDNANGLLINTATKAVAGTVNYSNGVVNLYNVATGKEIEAEFDSTFESNPSNIPSIEVVVDSTTVVARPRKLKGTYTLDAGYDLKQSQGIDIKDALLQAAAMQLKNETDGDLIRTAYDQAGNATSWTYNYTGESLGLSKKEYYEEFIEKIHQACSTIRKVTKRVTGNFVVCGKNAGDILTFVGEPRFKASGNTAEVGPYYAGLLDGRVKVYIDPFLGDNEFLVGFKGNTLIDAGLIYAPYLLFFATETVMLDDFIGRRGFSSSYGKKMVNRNLYIKGTITGLN